MKKNKHYLTIFVLTYVMVAITTIMFKRSDLFPWIGECHPGGYNDGDFMAYCNAAQYGNYEHWAYWNEIPPVSMAPVRNADVLFLGSSRTQYAFSTESVVNYFKQTGISHYVFGFGVGSLAMVPEKMIKKYHMTPKVLVINADPFFSGHVSDIDRTMLKTDLKTKWEFSVKRWMQVLQRNICHGEKKEGALYGLMCAGSSETVYRDTEYGYWKTDYYRSSQSIPVVYTDTLMPFLKSSVAYAEGFIRRVGINKSCMIVTVTPNSNTPLMFAQQLAKNLGVASVLPMVKGLKTIDHSHLDKESAERWSNAFLQKAAPYIEACTSAE